MRIKSAAADGRIRGEIPSDGTLNVNGDIDLFARSVWARVTLAFSTLFRDGVFSAKGYFQIQIGGDFGTEVYQGDAQYRITLTRATDAAR